ncbi:endonuclease domain-containing protein [Sinorhizobium medicae]|uniref:endonuclease domain-containing protein n=1 Tax=Sinorhizobium medicae TaxID=110321 RepID=UPI0003622B11|nr:endonuclease domain-containing protein [Sinorhizobium medicae]WQO44613.1 endonuclease domain-containing protein [Sinorhizobium medicae]WQO64768.1 endonuclease domain-containing protein [Sinorhizobium medicae]WQO71850.1 endonuclease domain-containing protein [Sinorhizobium medicae]WQO91199.1 endonuclease domain-containing protein [Sinorhizobium medicae]
MRGANERQTKRARRLRQADNDAEALLWSELRGRRLNGFKFVRQLPLGPYFADFGCRDERLVVEVDGSQHANRSGDIRRDEYMVATGWSVVRFWNMQIFNDRPSVLETIVAFLEKRLLGEVRTADLTSIPAKRQLEAEAEQMRAIAV